MRQVLVIGGTRFVGVRLVRLLVEGGAKVTIVSRGNVKDPFGDEVEHLIADRSNRDSFARAIGDRQWDTVFDQVCYAPDDAAIACELFADRVGRYIMTSTQSVYGAGESLSESAFDPCAHRIQMGKRPDFSYEDGKRHAEAVFVQRASFPVAAIRLPRIVGTDDYTGRIWWHVDRVRRGMPIGMPCPRALTSLICSNEAARFAVWLAGQSLTGPVNACADGAISYRAMIDLIEQAVGQPATLVEQAEEADMSPIGWPAHWYMSTDRARAAGFHFSNVHDWIPGLIRALAAPDYEVPRVNRVEKPAV